MYNENYTAIYGLDFQCIYVNYKNPEEIDLKIGTLILQDH